ncbi:hypothetical protein B6259_03090 [Ruminococcaceae bacterium CPB6]|jgi:soluble lytic murein transglycosylase|uniref:Transglycosylase SLT domain-containing protein n=2 Tax=Oscillospiraceae TaxID=216572 RepID=A0A859DR74_9FIRM|nr:hypothetical protein B6259_03090 [Ruminococcaceae bacterium CPB6]QKN24320.1 transglycosylase SLT domain-containing protein [Caproicibacterium lactatifermentans]QKO30667.1 transglycosylase SLT domain-containing protein [Caproicibacterium lactatifermentans]
MYMNRIRTPVSSRRERSARLRNRILIIIAVVAASAVLLCLCTVIIQRSRHKLELSSCPRGYAEYVEKEASNYHLESALIYAVIKQESNFDPKAVSSTGAIGLMQLMPDTFSWLSEDDGTASSGGKIYTQEDLYNPQINIHFGCKYLSILLKKYPNRTTALAAYNAGMGNVSGWLKNESLSSNGKTLDSIPFAETSKYTQKVTDYYFQYKRLYYTNGSGGTSSHR